jgi:hypothetical protein
MPPGVRASDIPGNQREEMEFLNWKTCPCCGDTVDLDIDDTCPKCGYEFDIFDV